MAAQKLDADRVEGAKPWHPLDRMAEIATDPVLHFARGLVGKRDRENLVGLRTTGVQEMRDPGRQRLCLARAILRKPRFLILDEATNAIDAGLEAELLQRLDALRGKVTILIITHRRSSVDIADKVLQMSDGRVEILEQVS